MEQARTVRLPGYSLPEERFNSLTHGAGALLGAAALALMAAKARSGLPLTCAIVFGVAIIATYAASFAYHAARPRSEAKRRLRIVDHCCVYLLVLGSYVPISLIGVGGALGFALCAIVLPLTAVGIALTVIDLDRHMKAAVACHLACGWSIVAGLPQLFANTGMECVALVVGGGVAYTVGAAFFALGQRRPFMHGVFHVFCLVGTACHVMAVYRFML